LRIPSHFILAHASSINAVIKSPHLRLMRTEKEVLACMPFSSCRKQMHKTKSAHNAEKVCAQGMSKHVYCDSREKHQKRQFSA
jgi:hypothetical protein